MPKERREVGLPQLLRLGTSRVLRVRLPEKDDSASITASLAGATLPPGFARTSTIRFPKINTSEELVRREEVVEWFSSVLNVLQADPATSADFFKRAAKAVVEMVDLDNGRVLFLEGGQWNERAVYVAPKQLGRPSRPPSTTLLQKVVEAKRTSWETPAALTSAPASMLGLESVVASPILSRSGEVIGALYGEREPRLTPGPGDGPITKLEAMLVELLAQGIAAGLSRVEEERKAGGAIALFEQFFGPALARFLAQTPGWERPRQANVTLLFCDIKGFTRISRKLTPQQTYEWVHDVLNTLSQCVLDNGGVLVDYVGDEIMSMWGAPQSQTDHGVRACKAAMDMMAALPAINERWASREGWPAGEATDLAVGLNSGTAQVGNVGSLLKFKYGGQGPTVNTASRVMNANKFFKSHVLMTRETFEQPNVKETFHARRLGQVLLNNVDEPTTVYEMAPEGRPDWPAWRDEYEEALRHFESVVPDGKGAAAPEWVARFGEAGRILADWRMGHADDLPALVLLSRAVNAMIAGPEAKHPVWEFSGK
jgi:adenylate cyclase